MSTDEHESDAYSPDKANIIARVMVQIYEQAQLHGAKFVQKHSAEYKEYAQQYAQQYSFEKGLKIFEERGEEAAMAELDQLHRRVCFTPISMKDLTAEEKRKAQLALMLLSEKSSGKIKGRAVYSCLLYTSPSPRDKRQSRMPSSA